LSQYSVGVSSGDLMFVPWFMTINQLGSKFKWRGEFRYSHTKAALQSQNTVFFVTIEIG